MQKVLDWYKKYHRLTNYISASMLYLKDNFFLEEELKKEHIKKRLLGHWGTVPGLNFIYAGLNYIISTQHREILFVAGPGHGAPAVLANVFVEGSMSDFYPDFSLDGNGMAKLIKSFCWPEGFPSHAYPGVPGSILEGGELGYSLGVAHGAAFDNPNLIVACIVGDGEAETATLSASWQSNKFVNPKRDGIVLPILHLNGYKISTPTIFGTMSKVEIVDYFRGLGYEPIYVSQYESLDIYSDFLISLEKAFKQIDHLKKSTSDERPKFPLIILKTKKGWTGPKEVNGIRIEDNNKSHGIPLQHPIEDANEFEALKKWLESYKVNELLNDIKAPKYELLEYIPKDNWRMGKNRFANGEVNIPELKLPDISKYDVALKEKGQVKYDKMEKFSTYLGEIMKENQDNQNFRIFSPDETESNMLEPLFKVTDRSYSWPVRKWDEFMTPNGRIMEILSENVLQSWMHGYNISGRSSVFISYEAFFTIISSQIDQYLKYLKQWREIPWRKDLPSMNYFATSTLWRQEHNGFTHQNPSLINSLLTKQSNMVKVYFPTDVNTLLLTTERCLKSTNSINLIIAGKRNMPSWLNIGEARKLIRDGMSIWDWAGNNSEDPDVVLASAGDYQTEETLAAVTILKEISPELKIRYVNINEITKLGFGSSHRVALTNEELETYFTKDRDIIFNFHGYPEVIKQMTWNREIAKRIKVLGYIEEGSTTTPFDMQVRNGTSRFHIAIHAIEAAAKSNSAVEVIREPAVEFLNQKLREHKE
jgi:xylulose-5-phosphate/fructose-6-phosphate phosphoketolase